MIPVSPLSLSLYLLSIFRVPPLRFFVFSLGKTSFWEFFVWSSMQTGLDHRILLSYLSSRFEYVQKEVSFVFFAVSVDCCVNYCRRVLFFCMLLELFFSGKSIILSFNENSSHNRSEPFSSASTRTGATFTRPFFRLYLDGSKEVETGNPRRNCL